MVGQEDQYPKSVTDAYNLMLYFKADTGQTHQSWTISADRTQMTLNQHEKGENDGEGTQHNLKDVLCYRCNQYSHYEDQCILNEVEAMKSWEAKPEARDQDRIKRETKEVTLMHVGGIKEEHATSDDEFEDDEYLEDDDTDDNVKLLFDTMEQRGTLKQNWVLLDN